MYALLFKQLKCAVIQAIKMLNILISVFFFFLCMSSGISTAGIVVHFINDTWVKAT